MSLVTMVFAAPAVARAQSLPGPEGPLWTSRSRAAEVLRRALDAHGGVTAIRDLQALSFRWEGEDYAPTQGRVPTMPWDTAGNARTAIQDVRIDLARNRYADQREFHFGGGYLNAFRLLGRGSEFLFYNPYPERAMAGAVYQRDTTGVPARRNLAAAGANMPLLLLRDALGRIPTLRYLGKTGHGGAREEVITFTTIDGELVTLYVNAETHLVSRREVMGAGSLGDEVNTFLFEEYRALSGFQLPRRMEVRWNGMLTGRHTLVAFAPAAEVADSLFEVPEGFAVQAPAGPPAVVPIGDGLAYVERLGGGYRMLVADTDEGLVIVDAPLSPAVGETAIRLIAEAFPGRPIRYVVITHHHGDHIGAIPAFAARDVTFLVAAGSEEYLRRMSTVRRTFGTVGAPASDGGGQASVEPRFEPLTGRRTIGSGTRAVEVLNIGPTSHAAAMLAVYVPSERLLFQGDLLRINAHGGVVAAPDAARDLDRIIRDFRLDVAWIGAVHGEIGTMADLRAALR